MNHTHCIDLITDIVSTQTTPIGNVPRKIVGGVVRFDFIDHVVGGITASLHPSYVPWSHKYIDCIDIDIGWAVPIPTGAATCRIELV